MGLWALGQKDKTNWVNLKTHSQQPLPWKIIKQN